MRIPNFFILKFWKYLSDKHKNELKILFLLMILSGIAEIFVINSVVPFLATLTNPETLLDYQFSKFIFNFFNLTSTSNVVIPIVFILAISVVISTALKLTSIWLTFRVAGSIGTYLNSKIFSNTLNQPYEYHLYNSSSQIIAANTFYIDATVTAIFSFLNIIYNLLLLSSISAAIVLVNAKLGIYSLIFFSFTYLTIGGKFKNIIVKNSRERASANKEFLKLVQEGLSAIRNIILETNQNSYIKTFKKYDMQARKVLVKVNCISEFPRYVVEAIGLLFVLIMSLFLSGDIKNTSSLIVSLGAFTFGLQKILPSYQKMYASWTSIKACKSQTESTLNLLEMKSCNEVMKNIIPLKFKKSVRFDSVFFAYKNKKNIISEMNLEIYKGQRIGIIGKTGSGKTTISDLLMGLLKPTDGKIYVDEKDIHDKRNPKLLNKWRSSISHVPQNIYLSDTTIAENIAFGIEKKLISLKKVKESARKAQINEFIESTKDGYFTHVGERGVRISGGQRQRIAIARALYKNSEILIFDEATSALDNNTEKELMDAINNLSNDLTIISIAHRTSSLKNFDRIIKLEKGRIYEDNKKI